MKNNHNYSPTWRKQAADLSDHSTPLIGVFPRENAMNNL